MHSFKVSSSWAVEERYLTKEPVVRVRVMFRGYSIEPLWQFASKSAVKAWRVGRFATKKKSVRNKPRAVCQTWRPFRRKLRGLNRYRKILQREVQQKGRCT